MLKFLGCDFDLADGASIQGKIIVDKFKYPIIFTRDGARITISYSYNPKLKDMCKDMFEDCRWHGFDEKPRKIWTCKYTVHNLFQIAYITDQPVYDRFDKPPVKLTPSRKEVKDHQVEFLSNFLHYRYHIIAGEMGTGKTLAMIEALELSGVDRCLWVGPAAALKSVQLEFRKWKSKVIPQFVSYSSLRKWVEDYPSHLIVPQMIIFDESQKIKSPTAQRSQAAMYLASAVRQQWEDRGYVALLSGSPAPKAPTDWWHQCETAVPGFLMESGVDAMTRRIGVVEEGENPITQGVYKKLVSWRDDEKKCSVCGQLETHNNHDEILGGPSYHIHVPAVNEVARLYNRMKGLVTIKFKKDCINLPDKVYTTVQCKPTESMLRAAKLITRTTPGAAQALVLLRELSDGFQYRYDTDGTFVTCSTCFGTKAVEQRLYSGPEITVPFLKSLGVEDEAIEALGVSEALIPEIYYDKYYAPSVVQCPTCKGEAVVPKIVRHAELVPCPKDDVVKDILEEYEDVGRVVFFAGFTESVDKLTGLVKGKKWNFIRIDGRGWHSDIGSDPVELLDRFQNDKTIENLALIGHPGTAGTGLNLTASPVICYYSNDFNAESRIQSEDRIHRIGMDENRGARIIDIVHLPVDQLIIDNLKGKRRLQDISMGKITESLERIVL